MASFIANLWGKKILGESLQNHFGTEDPYFEQVPATRLDGRPSSKTKRRKKALPPGISENDAKVLTKVKRRAYRLDLALFTFLGIRFGWSSAIGIIPGAGDAADALMALLVLKSCDKIDGGLPASLKARMMLNILFDFVIGLVPFVGDVADAVFRANTRNVVLLESHLREKGKKQLRQSGQPVPNVDPSSPAEYDRIMRENPPEYSSRPPSRRPSQTEAQRPAQEDRPAPAARTDAAAPQQKRGWSGWFSSSRGAARPHDEELGQQQGVTSTS